MAQVNLSMKYCLIFAGIEVSITPKLTRITHLKNVHYVGILIRKNSMIENIIAATVVIKLIVM